jgi:Tol biopolymer transport system component
MFPAWDLDRPCLRTAPRCWSDDIWLADIATGARRNLTQTPDRFECCAQWWPNQSDLILFNSWTSEVSGPNLGFPTVVRPDGEGYQVLDGEQVAFTLPAPSPDGQTVAYDRAGRPWLYRMDTGPEPFQSDLAPYDPLSDPPLSIVSPAWSPDGTKLAWIVGGNFAALGGWRLGIGMFDLQTDTFSLFHPYEPLGRGGWPSAPVWSPDGRWLIFAAWAQEGDEAGMWVTSADGEEEYHLACSCSNQAWSPDGHWLACTSTPPGYETCLVEVNTWETHRLDLPPDARLIDWIQP